MPTIIWSEDRVADLRLRWAEGLSATQIAATLGGVTRSAVLGKLFRLGLCRRRLSQPSSPRAPRVPRPSAVSHRRRPAIRHGSSLVEPVEGAGGVTDLLRLEGHMCR